MRERGDDGEEIGLRWEGEHEGSKGRVILRGLAFQKADVKRL